MSTTNAATNKFFILLMLVFLVFAVMWLSPTKIALPLGEVRVPSDTASHAIAKHGPDAIAVRECLNKGGLFSIWLQPNGKFMRLCQLPNNQYGVQVCRDVGTCFNEVTAFVKERISDADALLKYLKDLGAKQVWPPIQ